MKILKKILVGIAVLIVLLLIVALFVPKQYTVSASTTINKPQKEVFDYVKLIRNQENYSVWILADPNLKPTYHGTDGTVGFTASWNSQDDGIGEDVGEGSQTITGIIEGERLDVDLNFIRPFEGKQKAATIVTPISASQTKVTSEFYGNDPYPMNLMSLIGKPMLRDAQQQNMQNLKAILEK